MTPTRCLLVTAAGLVVLAIPIPFYPGLAPLWEGVSGVLTGVLLVDLLTALQRPALGLEREIRHGIPMGDWSRVTLALENRGRRSLWLALHDHHPAWFEVDVQPLQLRLPPGRRARAGYRVRPTRRGNGCFAGIDLSLRSPLGFWWQRWFIPLPTQVRVFPNFREIGRYALLAGDQRLYQMGVHRRQRRGEGSDFQQLREYRAGDSMRRVDWKASSRYRRLISREYQDERDQQLLFLLDCGRRMRHVEQGRAHLDQVLNGMLLLTQVAAREGDGVGFLSFGGTRRWVPPRKGGDLVRRFLHQTYDLDTSTEAADYLPAARELMHLQRRRALVVVLTNTRDEDYADLIPAVRLLQRRHLVVVANLRESLLDETLARPVAGFEDALLFHSVHDYLQSRSNSLQALRHQGAVALDLLASQLPAALVDSYLSIKASGRL